MNHSVGRLLNAFLNLFRSNPVKYSEVNWFLKERRSWKLTDQQYFELWRIFNDSVVKTGAEATQSLREQIAAAISPTESLEENARTLETMLPALLKELEEESKKEKHLFTRGAKRYHHGGGTTTVNSWYLGKLLDAFSWEHIVELAKADMLPMLEITKNQLLEGFAWEIKNDSLGKAKALLTKEELEQMKKEDEEFFKPKTDKPFRLDRRILSIYEDLVPYLEQNKPIDPETFARLEKRYNAA